METLSYLADCDRIFIEKVTGTKRERPELNRILEMLREGDTVIIADLTWLCRSTKDIIEIVEHLRTTGANLRILKEAWLDAATAHGKLMFTYFAGLAQFERDVEGLSGSRVVGTDSSDICNVRKRNHRGRNALSPSHTSLAPKLMLIIRTIIIDLGA